MPTQENRLIIYEPIQWIIGSNINYVFNHKHGSVCIVKIDETNVETDKPLPLNLKLQLDILELECGYKQYVGIKNYSAEADNGGYYSINFIKP